MYTEKVPDFVENQQSAINNLFYSIFKNFVAILQRVMHVRTNNHKSLTNYGFYSVFTAKVRKSEITVFSIFSWSVTNHSTVLI